MTDHVTDLAKLDIIAAAQAEDNEWRRVGVSRCFACTCANACACNMLMLEHSGHSDRYVCFPSMPRRSEQRYNPQFPPRKCTSTLLRPRSETTFSMTNRILLPLKHTWPDCLGRKLPCLLLPVQCPTNWPYVHISSSRRIPSSVITAPISMCVRQAGSLFTPALRSSQSSRPTVSDRIFSTNSITN